jgi:GT2 family glycosyltransferase
MSVPEVETERGQETAPCAAVLIPVFNGEHLLDGCLDALMANSPAGLAVLVVDDGSTDASVAVATGRAATSGGRIRVLPLGRNRGFAGAVNRGVAALLDAEDAPDVVVLVNQDCTVAPGWFEPLVAAVADPSVAVAGARLIDSDGVTLQHAGARIEANGLTSHFGRGSRDPLAHREARDADYVCGALLAMRASIWRRFGPFDEGYAPAYYEEVDFCVRARRAGLRAVYVPSSEAVHAEASTSGAGSRVFLRRYHRSRLRFVVRQLAGRRGAAGWMRAELAWLVGLRRWEEIRPVLGAYLRVPVLLAELVRERRRTRRVVSAGHRPARVLP